METGGENFGAVYCIPGKCFALVCRAAISRQGDLVVGVSEVFHGLIGNQ